VSRAEELRRERLNAVVKRNLTGILLEVTDSMFGEKTPVFVISKHLAASQSKRKSYTFCMLNSAKYVTTINFWYGGWAAQGQLDHLFPQWLFCAAEDIARKAVSTGVTGSNDAGKATSQETAKAGIPAAAAILNITGQIEGMLAIALICVCSTALCLGAVF
jgi:hypothetical protein